LLRRINETFYGYTTNTSYTVRSIFYEKKFYDAEKADLYDLGALSTYKEVQIDGADTADNVAKYFADDYLTVYKDYINRAILPSVMRKAIIEQYLYTKNYGTLGRSYARKVQYVALADSEYQTHTGKLVQAYAKDVINVADRFAIPTISAYLATSIKAISIGPIWMRRRRPWSKASIKMPATSASPRPMALLATSLTPTKAPLMAATSRLSEDHR
jgi:hypothetical protein